MDITLSFLEFKKLHVGHTVTLKFLNIFYLSAMHSGTNIANHPDTKHCL